MKLLSILICTVPDRKDYLTRLRGILDPQLTDEVEIMIDDRGRGVPTGEKRNHLIKTSTGKYFMFIDDDDVVAHDFIQNVLYAANHDPDVVTFKGWMTTNGGSRVDWVIKLNEKYEARKDADQITRYYRFPNHLCAMKRSLVEGFQFPNIWQGEDYAWALQIHEACALKNEFHIDKQLYHYEFRDNK